MTVAFAVEKMIGFYKGNIHDIDHFLKVWAYAKTIGEEVGLDGKTLKTLELAAVVHDISCPLCREKYGNTNGKNQEKESAALVRKFFEEIPECDADTERIVWLVSHHHTYLPVDGIDHRILLEADFLVNASEIGYSKITIENAREKVFRTDCGIRLLNSLYHNIK